MSRSIQLSPALARKISLELLQAFGVGAYDASVVTEHLVDADLSGITSHGLMRLPQYVQSITDHEIDPTGAPTARPTTETLVSIDGHRGFGQLAAGLAVKAVEAVALRHGTGVATVRNTGHIGRLGAYAEQLGRDGFLALLACTSPITGHLVAPYGGRAGRLATNPIAFAVPREGDPIVGDFSTGSMAEGRIRHLRDEGSKLPDQVLLDPHGHATTDPNALYGTPRGVIVPLGGVAQGHRGFALAVLVEALATLFPQDSTDDPKRIGNNLTIVALTVDPQFAARSEEMARYICSAPPIDPRKPVLLPGDPERQARNTIRTVGLEEPTWRLISKLGRMKGLTWSVEEVPEKTS